MFTPRLQIFNKSSFQRKQTLKLLQRTPLYLSFRVLFYVNVQFCVEPRTSAHHMTLPAAERGPWRQTSSYSRYAAPSAINRYVTPAPGLQQTSCTSLLLSIDGTDRQAGGHTDTVPLRRRWPLEAATSLTRCHNCHHA